MAKTRAPGGGRKPLASTEPTKKVAVTLLASQINTLTELGSGNLSKGIRIVTKKYSHRQHIIEKIADLIVGYRLDEATVDAYNKSGWTIDIRFKDGEYISENEWSRVENIHLDSDELATSKRIAAHLEATL